MIKIGFHTDAFNSSYWSFEQACSGRRRTTCTTSSAA